jgi:hypothetical protein
MQTVDFSIPQESLETLIKNSKDGKNSDIGKMAVEVVKLYFKSLDSMVEFQIGKNGADITVYLDGKKTDYEVKGTQDATIAFSKLKVSSQPCHDALINGMELIRVTNIRNSDMKISFLKHGIDFQLVEEPRWAVKKISATKEKTKTY